MQLAQTFRRRCQYVCGDLDSAAWGVDRDSMRARLPCIYDAYGTFHILSIEITARFALSAADLALGCMYILHGCESTVHRYLLSTFWCFLGGGGCNSL